MYPKAIKSYFAPTEISEVLVLLGQHKAAAKLLAGGQSLIPLMKLRLIEPRVIIDLNRVQGLNEVSERAGVLILGAMVRHADLAAHPLVRRSYSLLADAAGSIGDPQIRNRGTLAGSLVHADPAADYPPAIVALNGRLVLTKPNGSTRIVTADDFFVGPLTSALDEDELVTRIRIPAPVPHSGGAYTKNCQVAGDFAIISVAAQVTLDPSGKCQHAAIVIGGVMPKATRAPKAAALIVGTSLDDATLAQAGEIAVTEVETQHDVRASAEYRTQLIRVTVPQMLRQAAIRARGVEA
jgi:aerobic carbon-monoxide dehydrogenase medium subunit